MPTVTQRKNAKERVEYITELIKESGAEGVNGATICEDCGLNNKQRSVIMTRLMEKEPKIKRIGGTNRVPIYIWQEPKEEPKEEPKQESLTPYTLPPVTHSAFLKNRYKDHYNDEGYLDMTAAKAISNADKDLITPKPGEVWSSEESNGKRVHVYILAFSGDAVQCVKLYDRKEYATADSVKYPLNIPLGGVDLVGDLTRVTFKIKRYLIKRERTGFDYQYESVKKVLAKLMDFPSETVIQKVEVPGPERIVEKEVVKEVPVEKIVEKVVYRDREPIEVPDGYISMQEAKLADLQHQVEIWRSAFWAIAKNNRQEPAKN